MRWLVLFPGALGDLCLLAPSLAYLLDQGARVELCVQRSLVPLARLLLPAAVLGPPIDGAVMSSLFGATVDAALARVLADTDHVHAWLGRADEDGGLTARFAALGVSASLHAVPRGDAPRHVACDYAGALGITGPPAPLRCAAPASSFAFPWVGPEEARLVIHPGAGAPAKAWSAEGFRRVADAWRRDGGEVAILLGPTEEPQIAVWERSGHAVVAGSSIVEAAAFIASARSWLGNDSGASHVAGALGRRGVVLFGPTRAARWQPLGGHFATVEFAGREVGAVVRDVLEPLGAPFPRP